ncbi:hypothetical protein [Dokdonella soli]|uniref:Uncharacterized protein n=1 Tax=Dokdonella soli TaxID=529810 RepID=A0ABP3TPX9_9GAMM
MPEQPDKPDIDRRRRDLYAISLGLLVYNLAGGSLDTSTSTLFGSIHVNRVWVLWVGAWMMWSYFLWRFWLAARPIWLSFLDDVDSTIQTSGRYKEYCHAVFDLIAKRAKEGIEGFTPSDWAPNSPADRKERLNIATQCDGLARDGATYLLDGRSYARSLNHVRYARSDGTEAGNFFTFPDSVWKMIDGELPWQGAVRNAILRRALMHAAFRLHAFSDRILPIVVAVLAALVQLSRWIWHAWH